MSEIPKVKLHNGTYIPVLGLGTWQGAPGKEAEVGQAVKDAIDIGYRHFDCAHIYRNQKIIGEAIAEKIADGSITRDELFITSKLWNNAHRPDLVEPTLKETLENLQTDYLDLYLIHWPVAYKEGEELVPKDSKGSVIFSNVDYLDTWKAMEEVYEKGLVKAIGISNFNSQQIDRIIKKANIIPMANQIECHPYLNQKKLRDFCKDQCIVVTGYSPLSSPARPWRKPGDPDLIQEASIKRIAERYGKTPAQVLLRYQIELGNVTIPKSSNRIRLAQNMDIFDFKLKPEDMAYINAFDCNGRIFSINDAKNHPFYPFAPHVEF